MEMRNNKFVRVLTACAALFTAISCSNINNSQENEINQYDSPVIKIALDKGERTILPDSNGFEGYSFKLEVTNPSDSSDVKLTKNYENVSKLENDIISLGSSNFTIGNSYTFYLTAIKTINEAENIAITYTGYCTITLTSGLNFVPMQLYIDERGSYEGKGALDYTIDWSTAPTKDDVKAVYVEITNLYTNEPIYNAWYGKEPQEPEAPDEPQEPEQPATPEMLRLPKEPEEPDTLYLQLSTDNKIVIKLDELDNKSYDISVSFYDEDDIQLLQWDERAIIAEGLTSKGSAVIDALNKVYTVTFNFNYTNCPSPKTAKMSRFLDFSAIEPEAKRTGYIFSGWYKDAACSEDKAFNPHNEYITENTTLYAKWESSGNTDGSYNITATSAYEVFEMLAGITPQKTFELKVLGDAKADALYSIASAMRKNPNVKVKLDFTDSLNCTNLRSSFSDLTNLVEIILPASLDCINNCEFTDCTSLEKISIASGNQYFTEGEDGAIYNTDKTALFTYPAGKSATIFTIPASVKEIITGALCGLKNLTSFAIENGNKVFTAIDGILYSADGKEIVVYPAGSIAPSFTIPLKACVIRPYAFYGCDKLSEITFADTSYELKCENYYYARFMDRKDKSTCDDSSAVTKYLKDKCYYYYYNTSIACVSANAENIVAYDYASKYIQSGNFTIAEFNIGCRMKFYKLETEANKTYNLYWTENGYSYYDVPLGMRGDSEITVYTEDGESLLEADGSTETSFIAKSTTTYIIVNPWSNVDNHKCAFRVSKENTTNTDILAATVNVTQDDIDVNITDYTSTTNYESKYYKFYFNSNGYDSCTWYVDGSAVGSGNVYDFYLCDYTKGTSHTVTLQAVKGSRYYSYTAQIKVQ